MDLFTSELVFLSRIFRLSSEQRKRDGLFDVLVTVDGRRDRGEDALGNMRIL